MPTSSTASKAEHDVSFVTHRPRTVRRHALRLRRTRRRRRGVGLHRHRARHDAVRDRSNGPIRWRRSSTCWRRRSNATRCTDWERSSGLPRTLGRAVSTRERVGGAGRRLHARGGADPAGPPAEPAAAAQWPTNRGEPGAIDRRAARRGVALDVSMRRSRSCREPRRCCCRRARDRSRQAARRAAAAEEARGHHAHIRTVQA